MGMFSDVFGGWSARNRQQRADRYARRLQRIDHEFQEHMSSTAVTRRMADLQNAGINPILAGKWEASSPGGGVATGASGAPGGGSDWVGSALTAARFKTELANLKKTGKNIDANTGLKKAQKGALGGAEEIGKLLKRGLQQLLDFGEGDPEKSGLDKIKDFFFSGKDMSSTVDAVRQQMEHMDRKSSTGPVKMKRGHASFLDWLDLPKGMSSMERKRWYDKQDRATKEKLHERYTRYLDKKQFGGKQ